MTLREALCGFAAANGPADSENTATEHWHLGRGWLHIRVPNFAWRQAALARHDAHHVLTGYPYTPAGEMQMAAWEFAAGRYPHAGATAFCLPLVGMGALLLPRRTFTAFLRGRRSTSLYPVAMTDALLASRVSDLRRQFAPPPQTATSRDWLAFLALVGSSLAMMLVPLLIMSFVLVGGLTWLKAY